MVILISIWKQIKEAGKVSLVLFRIMVPVIIIVKILSELGLVKYIAFVFAPVMKLVGLPGEMGLVWATAIITNMYGGIVIFAAIAPALHLSTAQITVMACMILVAHSMPVEISIARKTGVRVRFMVPFRIMSAFLLGIILYSIYKWEISSRMKGESSGKPHQLMACLLPGLYLNFRISLSSS